MIYVAMLSERVAVVPPLAPSPRHLGPSTPLPFMNFGEVFDLPRLSRAIRVPVIEWKDVKKAHYDVPWSHEMPPVEGAEVDELGCWSKVQVVRGASPHRTDLEDFLQLGKRSERRHKRTRLTQLRKTLRIRQCRWTH